MKFAGGLSWAGGRAAGQQHGGAALRCTPPRAILGGGAGDERHPSDSPQTRPTPLKPSTAHNNTPLLHGDVHACPATWHGKAAFECRRAMGEGGGCARRV